MIFNRIIKRKEEHRKEHELISERLDKQEQEMEEMARRVRLLEIEAGIYNLQEVNGAS